METKTYHQLHIFFLPFVAQGHILPLLDIAKVFASCGVKSTIITTLLNAPGFSKQIQTSKHLGFEIEPVVIKFPSAEIGLPAGIERTHLATTQEMKEKFFKAITLLEHQVEQILEQYHPNCLIADSLFHWATVVAAKFGIPGLIFHELVFSPCASMSVMLYQPHVKVSFDSEPFVIPNLPDEIQTTRNQLPSFLNLNGETGLIKLVKASRDAEERSYGIFINSFYELEPDYVDHYRTVFGRKSWHIVPASLYNKAEKDKSERGREGSVDEVHECLNWLNSKKTNLVVYICWKCDQFQ